MFKKIALILVLVVVAGTIFAKNIISPTSPPGNPLQISYMRSQSYPGSDLKIEETLVNGFNYKRYIASYISEGLKIYGLLTVPNGDVPSEGFPAIIFNHGYITPSKYTPDGNYVAYVDVLARNGFVVFKPDYRGNGKSQGVAGSTYFSRNYDIDNLNAIASVKRLKDPSIGAIGVWGHSMGGHITLMDLVVSKNPPDGEASIKAAVIWGGVVGSYSDILYNWQNRVSYKPDTEDLRLRNLRSQEFLQKYGTPKDNPSFWSSIDPTENLDLITTPVQIHVGDSDNQVPPDFSENLYNKLKALGKTVEFYSYNSANHDISNPSFNIAMQRTVEFFKKYLI